MARFRHKRSSKLELSRHDSSARRNKAERRARRRHWSRQQEAQWAALHDICPNRASQNRLARLIAGMTGHDRGTRESALAELELATLLIRAGFKVELLPESQAATADLHCWLGDERIFVEVTALVGSTHRSAPAFLSRQRSAEGQEDGAAQPLLMSRLLARVKQKARQLASYAAPVVLAVTVPHRDPLDRRRDHPLSQDLDLKLLAGSITLLLVRLAHVSGVLLALWDVEPRPARSGVRLANVHMVERSKRQTAYPRVRMLILNPAARYPVRGPRIEKLKGIV